MVRLRFSPSVLQYLIARLTVRFMAQCPKVEVQVEAASRLLDVIKDGG